MTPTDDAVRQALAQHGREAGALLPVLHAVQDALGHVPEAAVPAIARALNLSRAEVHGVVSYYHFFRRTPPGRHLLQVCRAEACQACGADDLLAHAESALGSGGSVTLEPVYCLGLCASSPALLIDGRPLARVTPQALDELLAGLRSS